MRIYEIKRNNQKNVKDGKLKDIIVEHFKDFREQADGSILSSYGSLETISMHLKDNVNENGRKVGLLLEMSTEAKKGSDEEEMMKTHRVYNNFLLAATGLTTKERTKRLKKSVEKKD